MQAFSKKAQGRLRESFFHAMMFAYGKWCCLRQVMLPTASDVAYGKWCCLRQVMLPTASDCYAISLVHGTNITYICLLTFTHNRWKLSGGHGDPPLQNRAKRNECGCPAHNYSLFTILYSLRESFFHANRPCAFLFFCFFEDGERSFVLLTL